MSNLVKIVEKRVEKGVGKLWKGGGKSCEKVERGEEGKGFWWENRQNTHNFREFCEGISTWSLDFLFPIKYHSRNWISTIST